MHPLLQKRLDQLTGIHRSYRAVFGSPDGQRVLRHICRQGFVFKPSMNTGGLTEFNEGRRSLALEILAFIGKDEADIMKTIEMSQREEPYE